MLSSSSPEPVKQNDRYVNGINFHGTISAVAGKIKTMLLVEGETFVFRAFRGGCAMVVSIMKYFIYFQELLVTPCPPPSRQPLNSMNKNFTIPH